jgi:hypothetical protein
MPDRHDHVSIRVDRDGGSNAVRLPWRSRELLLRKLRTMPDAEGIVTAFEAGGATTPVELDAEQKLVLYGVLDDRSFTTGFHELPEGFYELRNALSDEAADV